MDLFSEIIGSRVAGRTPEHELLIEELARAYTKYSSSTYRGVLRLPCGKKGGGLGTRSRDWHPYPVSICGSFAALVVSDGRIMVS